MDELGGFLDSFISFFESEINEHGTEFKPFSRLPLELRLKIWRASWKPKAIWPEHTLYEYDGGHAYPPPYANLPVTAWINQESRNETLRLYRKISRMGYCIFDSYFNVKIDDLHLDACTVPICTAFNHIKKFKIQRLAVSTCVNMPENVYFKRDITSHDAYMVDSHTLDPYGRPDVVKHKSLENFLRCVMRPHFPSLRYLKIDWHSEPIFIEAIQGEIGGSLPPVLFRYREGAGGFHIVPLLESKGYLRGFEILFLGPRELASFPGKVKRAARYAGWLEFVGLALWNVLSPEYDLFSDYIVGFLEEQQDTFLF
ncbi:hypothetical protein PG988_013982 [Apiospora saccharicola]